MIEAWKAGPRVGLDAARAVGRDVAQAAHEPAGDEGLLAELEAREVAVGSGGGAARRRDEEGVVDLVRRGHEVGERGELVAEGAPPDDAVAVELGLHRLVLVGRGVPAVPVVLDARLRAELAGEAEAEAEVHPVLVPLDALVDVGGVELARAERAAARHEGEPPGVRLDAALGAGVDRALVVRVPEVVEVEPAGAGEAHAASRGDEDVGGGAQDDRGVLDRVRGGDEDVGVDAGVAHLEARGEGEGPEPEPALLLLVGELGPELRAGGGGGAEGEGEENGGRRGPAGAL